MTEQINEWKLVTIFRVQKARLSETLDTYFISFFALSPLVLGDCGLYSRLRKVNLKFYQIKIVSVAPLLCGLG